MIQSKLVMVHCSLVNSYKHFVEYSSLTTLKIKAASVLKM